MEVFVVGFVVGAVLGYFYYKRKQPKPNHNDAAGIPSTPRNENAPEDKK